MQNSILDTFQAHLNETLSLKSIPDIKEDFIHKFNYIKSFDIYLVSNKSTKYKLSIMTIIDNDYKLFHVPSLSIYQTHLLALELHIILFIYDGFISQFNVNSNPTNLLKSINSNKIQNTKLGYIPDI